MPYHRKKALWPHHTHPASTALASCLSTYVWSTNDYLVTHQCTWQMTFTFCLKVTVTSFIPQTAGHTLFQEPHLWNSLPSHFQHSDTGYNDLKHQLKTFFFGVRYSNILTHLLTCGLRLDNEAVRVGVGLRLDLSLCVPHMTPVPAWIFGQCKRGAPSHLQKISGQNHQASCIKPPPPPLWQD